MKLVERHDILEKGQSELSLAVEIEDLVFFDQRG